MSPTARYIVFSSYGNDSIALVCAMREVGIKRVTVVYSDTGWSSPEWAERVSKGEKWVRSLGYGTYRTFSVGFPELVMRSNGFPRGGFQFCTQRLKIKPGQEALADIDPEGLAVCVTGVRREESKKRSQAKEVLAKSPNHGGRALWQPLVRLTSLERDALIRKYGWEPLEHKSMECFPCIFANREDLRMLTPEGG